jgi:hypothetical protein
MYQQIFVVRIPYPPPTTEGHKLRSLDARTVDFPERGVSYMVVSCKNADWGRCALEVRQAVNLHSRGTEPERLEIRLPASQ